MKKKNHITYKAMSKELKEMTVRDVLMLDEFKRQMLQVMDGEMAAQEKAAYNASKQGARISRTPQDRLRERKVWEPDLMVEYFGSVLNKSLIGFSAAEREYIYLVGMEAFRRTMKKLQEQEK